MPIRVISSCNNNKGAIKIVQFDQKNPNIFIAGCGQRSDEWKLMANENCDEIMNFQSNYTDDGHVVFIIECPM